MPGQTPTQILVESLVEPVVDSGAWARPDFEVIALDCEITAYAPDGGDPLF